MDKIFKIVLNFYYIKSLFIPIMWENFNKFEHFLEELSLKTHDNKTKKFINLAGGIDLSFGWITVMEGVV